MISCKLTESGMWREEKLSPRMWIKKSSLARGFSDLRSYWCYRESGRKSNWTSFKWGYMRDWIAESNWSWRARFKARGLPHDIYRMSQQTYINDNNTNPRKINKLIEMNVLLFVQIPVLRDIPGVGSNYNDHPFVQYTFQTDIKLPKASVRLHFTVRSVSICVKWSLVLPWKSMRTSYLLWEFHSATASLKLKA